MARTAAIDRWFSLHAYGRRPDNYTAPRQVFQYGGRGFYENSREFLSLAERRGAAALEGYVTPAHARLMAGALRIGRASLLCEPCAERVRSEIPFPSEPRFDSYRAETVTFV